MEKLKVAIVDHVGIKAGMDSYDLGLLSSLRKQDCITFLYSNFESSDPDILNAFKFKVNSNFFSFIQLLGSYMRVTAKLRKKQTRHCIVHGFRFGWAEWLMIKVLKKSPVKIYMVVHDPESLIKNAGTVKWRNKIFDCCDALVVHNRYSEMELGMMIRYQEKKKLNIIPHGNFISDLVEKDTDQIASEYSLDRGLKHILFFGQIKESKGLDLLLEAMEKTDTGIHLIVAGRMRKHGFDKYQEIIDRLKLAKRVRIFPGYIPSSMRNDLFQIADAVVLPYRKVYQSGVMLMAMSYGKAVIASDLPPNRELISDGVNGFLFQNGSEDSLASVINEVMQNEALRERIAASGKSFAELNHSWNSIAKLWINLFNK